MRYTATINVDFLWTDLKKNYDIVGAVERAELSFYRVAAIK